MRNPRDKELKKAISGLIPKLCCGSHTIQYQSLKTGRNTKAGHRSQASTFETDRHALQEL